MGGATFIRQLIKGAQILRSLFLFIAWGPIKAGIIECGPGSGGIAAWLLAAWLAQPDLHLFRGDFRHIEAYLVKARLPSPLP
jgi:hypothetical protein